MRGVVFSAIIGLLFLSACSIQKRVAQPQLDMPSQLIADIQTDTLCIADRSWMEIFGDTILLNLIDRTLEYNKDMMAASARIREYEFRHRIARSEQFPSLGTEAYVDRETTKDPGSATLEEVEVSALLSLSWEIDFFGRLRWANREAVYNYLQNVEARRALQMTIIAEVATAYFELVALDKELEIVQSTIATRRENVRKAKLRFEGGLTSEIPYQQAQVELARTASMLPDIQLKIKIKENEISFLSGSYPSVVERTATQPSLIDEDFLYVGLPSDLVQRRPDVLKSELAYKSAVAKVGVEWANRFPRFVISLDAGFEHSAFRGFFSAPLTYMLANLTAPVFSFGKRQAQYKAALAACEARCYEYEEVVLQAFREVSDAVEAYRAAVSNTELMHILLNSSRKYVDLALAQYLNGHINYLDVLDAQRSYFNAEVEHSNAIRDQYLALINLYKALGGGWK